MNDIFKSIVSRPLVLMLGVGCLLAQASCKKDDNATVPPVVVSDQSFSQGFESMSDLTSKGWVLTNLSDTIPFDRTTGAGGPGIGWALKDTIGAGTHKKGAFEGSKMLYDSYLAGTDFSGNISDWLISPKLFLQNGDKISFYTVSSGSIDGYGDRLQLRLNTFNTSDSIGAKSTDVGNFTMPLVDVNPLYKVTSPGDYPTTWTKYEATITGLNQPDSGRFAIRYFVEVNGGNNGDELAIDKLQFTSAGH